MGGFSGLPRTTIGTTAGALASGTDSSHDAGLARALRETAANLSDQDMPVIVEIAASWLRVETFGGSWRVRDSPGGSRS